MHEERGNNVRRLMLGCAVALASCGGGSGGGEPRPSAPPAPARVVSQSDLQIAQLIYSDSQRTPPGFYEDTAASSAGYVATFHLKNTDLAAAGQQHELCTDDWNDALAWSEAVASSAAVYSDLVATESNTRFFEFGRVPRGQSGYLRARVYRCAYLDRASVNLLAPGEAAGQINRRPLSAPDLRELSEYLWLFTSYNNFGNVVLKSSGAGTANRLEHTLYLARLQAAASGGCDTIAVLAWTHAADLPAGTLALTQSALWSFGARANGGIAELCTP